MNAWLKRYGHRALLALVFLPVIFTRWLPQIGNPNSGIGVFGPHPMTNAIQAPSTIHAEAQYANGVPGMTGWFGLLNGTTDCSVKTALNSDNIALTGAAFRCTGGTAGSNFMEGGNFHCWFNAPGSNCMGIESDVNNFDATYPEGDGRGGYGIQIGGNSTFLAGKAIYITNPIIANGAQFQDGIVMDAVTTAGIRAIDPSVNLQLIQVQRNGDTQNRFVLDSAGNIFLGPGNATQDVFLSRNAAGVLSLGSTFGAVNGTFAPVAFANLPASSNGTIIGCSNCLPGSNPCTGASTGALAVRQNGAWVCK